VGGLPVFSRDWGVEGGKPKPFDQVVMDIPIGSGPYKIGPVRFGKDITYVRDPGYWAKDLNVRKGTANFDRITVKIYKDATARLEALKAGEFDLMRFFSAGDWARRVNGKKFDTGELVKGEFASTSCLRDFKAMCSTPAAPCCRMCACARRWAWQWTTSG
jgi:microcin C transport system substrate-binding protein